MYEGSADDVRTNPYFCCLDICKRDHEEKLACEDMKIAAVRTDQSSPKFSFYSVGSCAMNSWRAYLIKPSQQTRFYIKKGILKDSGKKDTGKLLCRSFLDHFKGFECFPSYGNIFIREKTGQVINGLLVANLGEQERCTLPHITLIIL